MRLTRLWRDLYRCVIIQHFIIIFFCFYILCSKPKILQLMKSPSTPQRFWLPLLHDSVKLWNPVSSFSFDSLRGDAQLKKVLFSYTVEAVELARAFSVECSTDKPDVEQTTGSINGKDKTRLHRIWLVCSSCWICETCSSNQSGTCFFGGMLEHHYLKTPFRGSYFF